MKQKVRREVVSGLCGLLKAAANGLADLRIDSSLMKVLGALLHCFCRVLIQMKHRLFGIKQQVLITAHSKSLSVSLVE